MKKYYIADILNNNVPNIKNIEIYGWICANRKHKDVTFFKVEDSTGRIDLVVNNNLVSFQLNNEQSVYCTGVLSDDLKGNKLVEVGMIKLIGDVNCELSPGARSNIDVFSEKNANKIVKNKHLYIRNQSFVGILKARNLVIEAVRSWFHENGYCDVTAPILTPILLYEKETGIEVSIKNQNVFLTQCVGFYLESAVHSLEKVYNIGPSFRGAESVSKRHLMEYWHIKSELAFCGFEEYFDVVEDLICYTTKYIKEHGGEELATMIGTTFCDDGMQTPFPRISYDDVVLLLNEKGIGFQYGKSLNDKSEKFLSEYFGKPFWITYKPKGIEGFPYRECKDNSNLTMTADLIASKGLGEILGIAEKITDIDELRKRLEEKGKLYDEYKWFCDIREYGTVQHCGLGMGLERYIRWLFNMNHVKDVIPFPRRINQKIYP
ncbi:MAG: hypothetical protein J6A73_00790 [Lachnospiraceae bacterium]|nr:hypothetical protein [Lachnospiraceae bacterium]